MNLKSVMQGEIGGMVVPKAWLPVEVMFSDWKDGYEALRLWVATKEDLLLPIVWPSFLACLRSRITHTIDGQTTQGVLSPKLLSFPNLQMELSGVQLQQNMTWIPLAFRLPDIQTIRMRNPDASREIYPAWKRGRWPQASVVYMYKIQPASATLEETLQSQLQRLEWGPRFKTRWGNRLLLPRSENSDIASPPSSEEIFSDVGSLPDDLARQAIHEEEEGVPLRPAE